ncbi:hypothetical protein WDU94_014519 [Cyamophila willieti]
MNWWSTITLVSMLVHNSLSFIILLQNLTGKASYDDSDEDYSDDQAIAAQFGIAESQHLQQIRGKRKIEDEQIGQPPEERSPVQCYLLRNNHLHPLRKRSRHARGHRRVKHVVTSTLDQSEDKPMSTTDNESEHKRHGTNDSIETIPSPRNNSNTDHANVSESVTACMEHQIKLKHKNSNLFKGRKHCVYHEKHQDILNDVSCDSHHSNLEKASLNRQNKDQQTLVFEMNPSYSRKTKIGMPSQGSEGTTMSTTNKHAHNKGANEKHGIPSDVGAKSKLKRPLQNGKQSTGKIKSLRNQNTYNHTTFGNNSFDKYEGAKQSRRERAPYKESQEIDLFTPIKELEAFIAAMSTDDYHNYFQMYWKNILLGAILLSLLLFCCFYYCLSGRVKSSDDATLFLIKPASCTNTNRSSSSKCSNPKSKKKDKINSSPSSGCVIKGKIFVTDDSDGCSSGRGKKSNKGYESYRPYRKGYLRDNCRNREEEECLLKPRNEKVGQYKKPPKRCDIYSYKGSNYGRHYHKVRCSSSDNIVNNYCFYGNKDIKELFKKEPNYVYHFSSVDVQAVKPVRESNVESYAETVTSSAMSRFKVTKPCVKSSKLVKKKPQK